MDENQEMDLWQIEELQFYLPDNRKEYQRRLELLWSGSGAFNFCAVIMLLINDILIPEILIMILY